MKKSKVEFPQESIMLRLDKEFGMFLKECSKGVGVPLTKLTRRMKQRMPKMSDFREMFR